MSFGGDGHLLWSWNWMRCGVCGSSWRVSAVRKTCDTPVLVWAGTDLLDSFVEDIVKRVYPVEPCSRLRVQECSLSGHRRGRRASKRCSASTLCKLNRTAKVKGKEYEELSQHCLSAKRQRIVHIHVDRLPSSDILIVQVMIHRVADMIFHDVNRRHQDQPSKLYQPGCILCTYVVTNITSSHQRQAISSGVGWPSRHILAFVVSDRPYSCMSISMSYWYIASSIPTFVSTVVYAIFQELPEL